jgi:hypothetical protein
MASANSNNGADVVFWVSDMRTGHLAALLAASLTLLAVAAPEAPARLTEVGKLDDGVRGSCPRTCFAMSRTTGYQAKVGPNRGLYTVPRDGRIVAWTVALGRPGPTQRQYFEERLGFGKPQAALVVLRPGNKLYGRVIAKAPVQNLERYYGQTAQFPLTRTIAVKKGQILALTVPTWAPVLQVGLASDTSWRASRPARSCDDNGTQTAMLGRTTLSQFRCLYKTARLTYSATLVSTP